nr:MAG TPA: hypothetical protein [Caudoviricetes sp.]DAM93139.1 MAG TPA: hypothetical protein [Caudoviricetes sp.]
MCKVGLKLPRHYFSIRLGVRAFKNVMEVED